MNWLLFFDIGLAVSATVAVVASLYLINEALIRRHSPVHVMLRLVHSETAHPQATSRVDRFNVR